MNMTEKLALMSKFLKAYEEHDEETLRSIDLTQLPDIRVMQAFVKAHEEVEREIKESEARSKNNDQ